MAKKLTISFPTKESPDGYFFNTESVTSRAISSNLLLLLTTQRGERWYYPEFGTDLRKYLYEQNDLITEEGIKNEIESTVAKFIPKLTIDKINVENEGYNTILLDIFFTYKDNYFSDSSVLTIRFKK
jgi:phage baseplate assembly protein W